MYIYLNKYIYIYIYYIHVCQDLLRINKEDVLPESDC